ncbi:hypothetical protein B296_00058036 [Ensete ventricosum]|uniref:Uncharacterized protein n=1 Tax=Ensete ventricosum TaxID=4639 RepID=A0A426XNZ8_ENSVE|nr:hypothetical protein B296_00058036 [Ensete ventricosum]
MSVAHLLVWDFRRSYFSGSHCSRSLLTRAGREGFVSEGAFLISTFVFLEGRSISSVELACTMGAICDGEGLWRGACLAND